MSKKARRSFTKEFKKEAVSLVVDQGYRISEAARNLDIGENLLGRWMKELKAQEDDAFRGNGNRTGEQQRIYDLEKQVKRLEMEKEILKKATQFFAKESR